MGWCDILAVTLTGWTSTAVKLKESPPSHAPTTFHTRPPIRPPPPLANYYNAFNHLTMITPNAVFTLSNQDDTAPH